jgi:hypothetical protein
MVENLYSRKKCNSIKKSGLIKCFIELVEMYVTLYIWVANLRLAISGICIFSTEL